MKHTIFNFIRKHFYPLLLILITGLICIANYTPDTWLSGWDTLHPEFNFPLNFERIINGVWREEQGLGAVAVHSHMSELPRYIFLWIFSLLFPLSTLRYLYIFLCFILGPLGIYYFLQHIFSNKEGIHKIINASAFLGALAYIFNIATLHQFSVPFEMFPTQYAFLPWLFLTVTRFLQTGKRNELLYFALITFLATPMAYAAQLWYAYFSGLILYISLFVFQTNHSSKTKIKLALIPIVVTILINSFWLFPHLYELTDTASWVPRAHVNELFSEQMFAYNKARGTIADVAILRGSLYDWEKFDGSKFIPLFDEWGGYMDQAAILAVGYIVFGAVMIGVIVSLARKNTIAIAMLPVGLMAAVALMNMNAPFDMVFGPLRDHFPLFREALRSPYTKFSIILLFSYCFYFSYAFKSFIEHAGRTRKYIVAITAVLLVFYMLPFFQGKLIDPAMRIKLPQEYFELFDYFKKQPKEERIATAPYQTFWAWEYYRFGYQGAGFLWFGLPQPLLTRDFDRWNPNNENYYWEISHAVYSNNFQEVEKVLTKYRVSWLILDQNTISPDTPQALYFEKITGLFDQSQLIRQAKKFGNILVYRVDLPNKAKSFTYSEKATPVSSTYTWNNQDQTYQDSGDYISGDNNGVVYPFPSLFSGKRQEEKEFSITETPNSYLLAPKTLVSTSTSPYILTAPTSSDELIKVNENTTGKLQSASPILMADGKQLTNGQDYSFPSLPSIQVAIPKIAGLFTFDTKRDINLRALSEQRCDRFKTGNTSRFMIDNTFLRLTSLDASNCLDLSMPNLPHRYSYLVTVETRNISGSPLLFSVINKTTGRTEIQTYLPTSSSQTTSTFVIPPLDPYGVGYSLLFDNIAIGIDKVSNDIGRITLQPFPYRFVKDIRLTPPNVTTNPILIHAENFDRGWLAYETPNQLSRLFPILFGKRLTDHVLVNNWANGWKIPQEFSSSQNSVISDQLKNPTTDNRQLITIVYWPQYLEYVGFGLLGLSLIFIAHWSRIKLYDHKHNSQKN